MKTDPDTHGCRDRFLVLFSNNGIFIVQSEIGTGVAPAAVKAVKVIFVQIYQTLIVFRFVVVGVVHAELTSHIRHSPRTKPVV
jgi:hypothetical protein